jgi:N,N-dimethylformamidase beta subunit-like, C-terminal/Abnormal spindle-like microcephaly-assoc'd, ASPM-SPD-2-Hydin/Cep192 domain 4
MNWGIFTGQAPHRSFHLRSLLRPVLCTLALVFAASVLHAQNPIQIENAKAGTSAWQITNLATSHEIEGYASLTSVNRGGQISFFVNTVDPTYTIRIFRMGWYQGLGARLVLTTGSLPGVAQTLPTPDPTTGLIECNWTSPYVLTLDSSTDPASNWVSGVYVALLTGSSGKQSYIVFVVRDDSRASNYFFECAVDTYEAYNNWGGKSLYSFNSVNSNPAVKVSFNRPYGAGSEGGYGHDGAGDFIEGWEYDAVRFLEHGGYDVTYGTDVDVHENSNLLLSHKADLIFGHSEYWSWQMRANVVAARDQGVSLGIFAANTCYWQIRFEPSTLNSAVDRTIVGYKDFATSSQAPGPDPDYTACTGGDSSLCQYVTVRWREAPVNMPENAFVGVMYAIDPVDGDILITNASSWVFKSTGLQDNDTLPGLLGYEVDSLYSNGLTPPGTVTLAASPYTVTGSNPPVNGISDMTIYTAPSGAIVFATGSIQFAWGLDGYSLSPSSLVSAGAQQMTRNLLAAFVSGQPLASPSPGSLGFGNQSVETTSATKPVTLTNTGSVTLNITNIAASGDFAQTNNCGSSVAGGASCTISVTFTPTATGARSGALTIMDDALNSPQQVSLTGTGIAPAVSFSPTSLTFSGQLIGTTSAAKPVTLTNTGAGVLSIASIAASGDFAQTNNCGSSVAGGANCTISVTFAPTAPGTRTGAITLTDNAADSPQSVSLTGTGTGPFASLSPPSLFFGVQALQTTSAVQTITITDVGTTSLSFSSFTTSGDFAVNAAGTTCSTHSSLKSGSSCSVAVAFTPTASGPLKASLSVADNAADSPQTAILTGLGTAAGLSPASLNFPSQAVGTPSAPMTVTLTNLGAATINLWQIIISGSNAADFAMTTTCGPTLAAGNICTVSVIFTPAAAGTRTASLLFSDDTGGSPQSIPLSGSGTSSPLVLTPSSQQSTSSSGPPGQSATHTNEGMNGQQGQSGDHGKAGGS